MKGIGNRIFITLTVIIAAVLISGCAFPFPDFDVKTSGGLYTGGSDADKTSKPEKQDLNLEVSKIRQEIRNGNYDKAASDASALSVIAPDDAQIKNLIFSTSKLVPYEGKIEHIFFHPLIAYPERAKDGKGNDEGQDRYMVTVPEFNSVIEQMYTNGYMLISMHDLFSFAPNGDGTVTAEQKQLMLPAGKKPYILSIDDMNYYEYMLEDGQVSKLVLDENGEVAAKGINIEGNDEIRRDNEIVPIIDDFVKAHPDSSFNGAKGLIALTGYEGILGYRTNSIRYPSYEQERDAVMPVIRKLKDTGWEFASHSQGHRHTNAVDYDVVTEDTDRWSFEVQPLIGDTPIYIYPFGEKVADDDPKLQYLRKNGFAVFCAVGSRPYLKKSDEGFYKMDRRAVDGVTLRRDINRDLFDGIKIIDANYRAWLQEYISKHKGQK